MKRISSRLAATTTIVALAVGGTAFGAQAAMAATPSFAIYDESDSPNPYEVTNALVFYKAADLGWQVNAPLSDVKALAYTVADSDTYAPSFQLVTSAVRPDTAGAAKYARLVWEPYQQSGATEASGKSGAYTDLQNGLWWTNKIANPAPGSQSSPQPLSFFTMSADDGGAGWTGVTVTAVDVHQGTTTEGTSTVTKVSYNGTDIQLGHPDESPFSQADVDKAVNTAVAPLKTQVADLTSQLAATKIQLAAFQVQIDNLKLYAAKHHIADGTNMGVSRALLSATPAHGKTVGVVRAGTIATSNVTSVKYQWYLSGKAVRGATKSTYRVPSSAKGRSVSVKVTATYKGYIVFSIHSNTLTAK